MSETFEGPRGLKGYLRHATAHEEIIEVQESSSVLSFTHSGEVEGPFVWLRIYADGSRTSAHLSVEDVAKLTNSLIDWLRDNT